MSASSRRRSAEHRREEVLAAAETLIAVHGYDVVKLRDVAAEAKVSIGLIQHYFITRDDLMREAMAAASARRIEIWSRSVDTAATAWERISGLLVSAVMDRKRSAVWIELCAASTHHPELRADVDSVQRVWRARLLEAVEEGVVAGEFAPVLPPDVLAEVFVNLIDGKLLEIATTPDRPVTSSWISTTETLARRLLGHQDAGDPLDPRPAS